MIAGLLHIIARGVLRLRYRVRTKGLDAVRDKGTSGILFLPNHPALVDPLIVLTELFHDFHPTALADKDQIDLPVVRWIARKTGVRPLPDVKKYGKASEAEVQRIIQECIEGLKTGANVLIYPAGHLAHSRNEDLGGASAADSILKQSPDARVVLVRTRGLWGSSFSRASGNSPVFVKQLRAVSYLLINFIFFSPRREVLLEFHEPLDLPRTGSRNEVNRRLEDFYNENAPQRLYVPHTIWERGGTRVMPEPEPFRIEGDLRKISATTRELVLNQLRELSGIRDIADTDGVARDLGLDSLARIELQLWIEREFGFQGVDPESLQSVSDVLLAATGNALNASPKELKPIDTRWFRDSKRSIDIPEGKTITEVFLAQAALGLNRPLLADQTSGVRTYRDVITSVLALKPILSQLDGEYVGVMLPASAAAAIIYLALLFSGKIPVMMNWTAGARNLAHAFDLLGIRRVLTAGQLVSKIEAQGLDLTTIKDRLLLMEDVGRSLGMRKRLVAFLKAHFNWSSLRNACVPDTAVVLFTSGSESLPKAVPLSHANLLANLRDLSKIFSFNSSDRMIGILPPFHSFGLTGTSLLPLCSGMEVVYHPNPTEGVALARIIEAYRVSILVGTPTFLNVITRAARDEQLAGLRLVVTGAEKCPEQLYESIERRWPHLSVVEGYGITECSPVVSCNRETAPRRGTIGYTLPSLEFAVVDLETGKRVEASRSGMLLVRGTSIFKGYLHYDGDTPFINFEGKSWYRTGDLVHEEADGLLIFAGRLKRFVKLGGEMVSLPAVEEALLARFGNDQDQEIILAVEATPSDSNPELTLFTTLNITREEANVVIRDTGLSPLHNIRSVITLDAVPILGTGKTDYLKLKSLLHPQDEHDAGVT
jgi:acyl-CoA synthetase (AMP-forming)/AMP-acid ligase II/1-acyl-sn-glycerol-3-phosphate acyltransferase/acyl carrier protein